MTRTHTLLFSSSLVRVEPLVSSSSPRHMLPFISMSLSLFLCVAAATHAHARKSEHHVNSSHHAAWQSLAEVSSFLQAGVPGLDDIMEPILNLVLEPVTAQVISMVGSSAMDSIKNTLPDEMEGEVPEDVAECLRVALTHNLTSLLTDTVTAAVATEVVPQLRDTLFASLRKHALTRVVPWLLHQLEPSSRGSQQRRYKPNDMDAVSKPAQSLTHAIRGVVAKEVTGRLHDTLSFAILPRLTQTLTLSIVPPLVSRWHGVPRGLSVASCERAKKQGAEGGEEDLPMRVLCDPDSLSDVWAKCVCSMLLWYWVCVLFVVCCHLWQEGFGFVWQPRWASLCPVLCAVLRLLLRRCFARGKQGSDDGAVRAAGAGGRTGHLEWGWTAVAEATSSRT